MNQVRRLASVSRMGVVSIGTVWISAILISASLFFPAIAQAEGASDVHSNEQIILRVASDKVDRVVERHALGLVRGFQQGTDSVLLAASTDGTPAEQLTALLLGDADVRSAEVAGLAALPAIGGPLDALVAESDVAADLMRRDTFSSPCNQAAVAWSGYTDQRAAALVNLHAAHRASSDCGASATVAIIDNAVDSAHPLLQGVMVAGHDFRLERSAMQQNGGGLDQSIMAILERQSEEVLHGQGSLAMLEMAIAPIVDADLASILQEESLPPFFGHGTMVAGLVHLAAPAASIMPLRVFDDHGNGQVYDVVRAIYHAVDHGADVINMSFSLERSSRELVQAISYARNHGVVSVAAVGNDGARTRVYPAGLGSTVGVAATDQSDGLSTFTNYGSGLVSLAAPGVALVSTFPNGHYAAAWGTSFSTPLVAGTLALMEALVPDSDSAAVQEQVNVLARSCQRLAGLEGEIGSGRLDTEGALLEAAGR